MLRQIVIIILTIGLTGCSGFESVNVDISGSSSTKTPVVEPCSPLPPPGISAVTSGRITINSELDEIAIFPTFKSAVVTLRRGCWNSNTQLILGSAVDVNNPPNDYNLIEQLALRYSAQASSFYWFKLSNSWVSPTAHLTTASITLDCPTQSVNHMLPGNGLDLFSIALSDGILPSAGISPTANLSCDLVSIDVTGPVDVVTCNQADYSCPGNSGPIVQGMMWPQFLTAQQNMTPGPLPSCGSVDLNWQPVLKNFDGTPVTNLAGYAVYYGLRKGEYSVETYVNDPSATSYTLTGLTPGLTYHFSVRALDNNNIKGLYAPNQSLTLPTNCQ